MAVGLHSAGAHVTVHARNAEKAQAVAALAQGEAGVFPPPPGSWDLLVNCTPVGMHPVVDESPFDARHLLFETTVFDTVYNPEQTLLIKQAREIGCKTITGIDMFVGQAALLRCFAEAIRTGRPGATSGEDNLWSFAAVTAGVISAREERGVDVGGLLR